MRGTPADLRRTQYAEGWASITIDFIFFRQTDFGVYTAGLCYCSQWTQCVGVSRQTHLSALLSGDLPKSRWQNLTSLLKSLMQVWHEPFSEFCQGIYEMHL